MCHKMTTSPERAIRTTTERRVDDPFFTQTGKNGTVRSQKRERHHHASEHLPHDGVPT